MHIEDGLFALGAFLDIKSAFDNTIFESICRATEEHNIVRRNHTMLSGQQIVTAQMGCIIRVSVGRSPVLPIVGPGG
jgi:hypothetical protein